MKPCAFCKYCILNSKQQHICINPNTTIGIVNLSANLPCFEPMKDK